MSELKYIATRESYGNALKELGEKYSDIVVLDADLSGATRTSRFKGSFPERFIQCGIAESNMVGVAAGLSTMGFVPFVSSFAMFAAGRAFEQIRNSVGYPHLNVKIAATHGGLSVGEDGATHQCCEDFALMRSIPGMVVMSPSDDVEAKQMVEAAYHYKGPVYMRFSRSYSPIIHNQDYRFKIGKGEIICEGTDVGIISNGIMVWEAITAANILKDKGISVMVVNMPVIKPIDEDILLCIAQKCKKIVVAEEHSIIGGLGEAVCREISKKCAVRIECIGVEDKFGHSGPATDILKEYGLSSDNIVKKVLELFENNP